MSVRIEEILVRITVSNITPKHTSFGTVFKSGFKRWFWHNYRDQNIMIPQSIIMKATSLVHQKWGKSQYYTKTNKQIVFSNNTSSYPYKLHTNSNEVLQ